MCICFDRDLQVLPIGCVILLLKKVVTLKLLFCDFILIQKAHFHKLFERYCWVTTVSSDDQFWNYFCKLEHNKFQTHLSNIPLVSSFCCSLFHSYVFSKLKSSFRKLCKRQFQMNQMYFFHEVWSKVL